MRADQTKQMVNQLQRRLTHLAHQIHQKQAAQNSVAFRHVTAKRKAARFFAADERIRFQHFRRDKFETDTRFVHGHIVHFAEFVQHRSRRNRFHNRSAQSAHFKQIICEQRVHFELIHKASVLGDKAHAVGIAVGEKTRVGICRGHGFLQARAVWRNRFGTLHIRKNRIASAVNFGDSRFAAIQNAFQPTAADAPHRVMHHMQSRVFQRHNINHVGQMREIRGARVKFHNCVYG